MSKGKSKVTLQEYLQTVNIRRKLQYRSKSKSRGKQVDFKAEHTQSMDNIFLMMDDLSFQLKIDFHQYLQKVDSKQKFSFHLSGLMDRLILRVKEEIKKMYKDIYLQYIIEHQKNANPDITEYFRGKVSLANGELKKMHLGEMVREKEKERKQQENMLSAMLNAGKSKGSEKVEIVQKVEEVEPVDGGGGGFMEALLGIAKKSQREEEPEPPKHAKQEPPIQKDRKNNHIARKQVTPKKQSKNRPKVDPKASPQKTKPPTEGAK